MEQQKAETGMVGQLTRAERVEVGKRLAQDKARNKAQAEEQVKQKEDIQMVEVGDSTDSDSKANSDEEEGIYMEYEANDDQGNEEATETENNKENDTEASIQTSVSELLKRNKMDSLKKHNDSDLESNGENPNNMATEIQNDNNSITSSLTGNTGLNEGSFSITSSNTEENSEKSGLSENSSLFNRILDSASTTSSSVKTGTSLKSVSKAVLQGLWTGDMSMQQKKNPPNSTYYTQ